MPSLLVLSQHYRPDEAGGALRLAEMAEHMAAKDFQVEAWSSARSFHDPKARYPLQQNLNGVSIWRVNRPPFRLDRPWGRAVAHSWTLLEWAWRILFQPAPDLVLLGSDPPFAHFLAPWIRLRWGKSRLLFACRALYPEAWLAEAPLRRSFFRARLIRWVSRWPYSLFHGVVVPGSCVQERFAVQEEKTHSVAGAMKPPVALKKPEGEDGASQEGSGEERPVEPPKPPPDTRDGAERFAEGVLKVREKLSRIRIVTGRYPARAVECIPPWAPIEPSGPVPVNEGEVQALLGVGASGRPLLCLMVAGTLGVPHRFRGFLDLSRAIRDQHHALRTAREQINRPDEAAMGGLNAMGMGLAFAETRPPIGLIFGVRGSRVDELKAALTPGDDHVRIVPSVPGVELRRRLSAADVQGVSLDPAFTGTLVPSRFLAALAVGRPVVFEGHPDSSIARWIREFKLGWVLTDDNVAVVAADLLAFAGDEKRKDDLMRHCHQVYQFRFAKKFGLARWEAMLRAQGDSRFAPVGRRQLGISPVPEQSTVQGTR